MTNDVPADRIRRLLLDFFDSRARDLPWRRTDDPYAIWVSEIMLQQTQVATVRGYFARFVQRFPTIADLAAAPEEEVLRLWEGLGYYRRARQLHAAAQRIVSEHSGQFPRDMDAVLALPGIGRYTAGAILSIAFGQRQPILEANTQRLYARLAAIEGDLSTAATLRRLWQFAEELLPRREVGEFNQALMELGSLVCRPHEPDCGSCPVAGLCAAQQMNRQREIPQKAKRPELEDLDEAAVVLWRGGQVLIRRCQPKERWAGLWDFPRVRLADGDQHRPARIVDLVQQLTGVLARDLRGCGAIRHGVTRYRIRLHCYQATAVLDGPTRGELRWTTPTGLQEFPLSATGRKIAARLTSGMQAEFSF